MGEGKSYEEAVNDAFEYLKSNDFKISQEISEKSKKSDGKSLVLPKSEK